MKQLFHLPLSPFSRKIRLVLGEKKISGIDLVEERPWERRRDFLLLNPAGDVPVLHLGHTALSDSTAIFEYLEEIEPTPALLPQDALHRAEARRLVAWFDDKFYREVTDNLLHERVTKKLMKEGYPDGARIRAGATNIRHHLDYMDWLLQRRHWLAGEVMTIADFAAAAHLSCLDYINDVDWNRSEPVRDWYARIKSRPAFRPLLSDAVPGLTPPPQYADLDF
ncbi:MAG: glutathione S-transferase family protein [Pseudomonadota bacterium]